MQPFRNQCLRSSRYLPLKYSQHIVTITLSCSGEFSEFNLQALSKGKNANIPLIKNSSNKNNNSDNNSTNHAQKVKQFSFTIEGLKEAPRVLVWIRVSVFADSKI